MGMAVNLQVAVGQLVEPDGIEALAALGYGHAFLQQLLGVADLFNGCELMAFHGGKKQICTGTGAFVARLAQMQDLIVYPAVFIVERPEFFHSAAVASPHGRAVGTAMTGTHGNCCTQYPEFLNLKQCNMKKWILSAFVFFAAATALQAQTNGQQNTRTTNTSTGTNKAKASTTNGGTSAGNMGSNGNSNTRTQSLPSATGGTTIDSLHNPGMHPNGLGTPGTGTNTAVTGTAAADGTAEAGSNMNRNGNAKQKTKMRSPNGKQMKIKTKNGETRVHEGE